MKLIDKWAKEIGEMTDEQFEENCKNLLMLIKKKKPLELKVERTVDGGYSLDDVRNIVLEMHNEAMRGLIGEQRLNMQKRLSDIRDKWGLDYYAPLIN